MIFNYDISDLQNSLNEKFESFTSGSFHDIVKSGVYYVGINVTDKPNANGGLYLLSSAFESNTIMVGLYVTAHETPRVYFVHCDNGTFTYTDITDEYFIDSALSGKYDKSGGEVTDSVYIVRSSYPSLGFRTESNGANVGSMLFYSDSNRLAFRLRHPNSPTHYEGYILPAATSGLTADKQYSILTEKTENYAANDTYSESSSIITGLIRNSAKSYILRLVLPKSMAGISTVTVTTLNGNLFNKDGSPVTGSSNYVNFLTQTGVSSVAATKVSNNTVLITVTTSSALTNAVNGPAAFYGNLALKFT